MSDSKQHSERPEVEALASFALTVEYGRPILDLCDYIQNLERELERRTMKTRERRILELEEQYEGLQAALVDMQRQRDLGEEMLRGTQEQLEAAQELIAMARDPERWDEFLSASNPANKPDGAELLQDIRQDRIDRILDDSDPASSPLDDNYDPMWESGDARAAGADPASRPATGDECSDCGHEHVNGRSGSCSKFACQCREWVAPVSVPASEPHSHTWSLPTGAGVYRCMTCGAETTELSPASSPKEGA